MIKTYIDGVLQESGGLPPTPTNPTTKFLNGNVEWAEISVGSGGYASNLYFTETDSTINPAYKQISYINQPTQVIKSVVVNNSESLIQAYIFDSPIGITQIDAGSWTGSLFSYVSASGGISTLKIEVYSRTVGGVETFLFEKYSNEINNTTGEYIKTETIQPVFTINATDYLVLKVYGKTTATANRTISYVIGDGNASYMNTPLALRHNQLRGLNDDVNFQHITATDRTKLNNLSGTNTGDETASTIINKIGDGSKINSNYLPSYVDDVLEFANVASFPATGETGKIYIALDVNLTYRWGGSGYVEISPSIALGETSATAYRGDRGKIAYDHSQITDGTNPHQTTFANIQSKPTTIAGYGITNGVTLTGTETLTNKTLTAPVLNNEITGTGVTTTGEANKLFKFSSTSNTALHELTLKKSSTTAFKVQNDSGTDIINIDSANLLIQAKRRIDAYYHILANTLGNAGTGSSPYIISSNGYTSASNPGYTFWTNATTGIYHPSADNLGISTGGVGRALFNSSGLTLPNLAGTGSRMVTVDASGNLSAGVMAYAENSYNPTLSSTGQTGSWTYNVQYGKYVRIGNKLTIHITIRWSAKPSTGTNIKISLPAQADVQALRGFLGEYSGITFAGKELTLSNNGNDAYNAYLFQNSSEGGSPVGINVSDVGSSGYIYCMIETLLI